MKKNKKILLFLGIILILVLSSFTYQTYFTTPSFENKTLVNGLQIALPVDSDFVDVGNNTFHDNKTNMNLKILKSENDVNSVNLMSPEKSFKNGSNTIRVFKNYTVVTDEKSEIGIIINNISEDRKDIAMKMAQNTLISPSLKSPKIGEDKAKTIAQNYENKLNDMLVIDATSTFKTISLTKFRNKTVYKVTFMYFQDTSVLIPNSVNKETINSYVDAYSGKIIAIEELSFNKNDPLYRGLMVMIKILQK